MWENGDPLVDRVVVDHTTWDDLDRNDPIALENNCSEEWKPIIGERISCGSRVNERRMIRAND